MSKAKGQVLSFWIPSDLREKLDDFHESYADKSRSHYICEAITEFLADPTNRYLVEKVKANYYDSEGSG